MSEHEKAIFEKILEQPEEKWKKGVGLDGCLYMTEINGFVIKLKLDDDLNLYFEINGVHIGNNTEIYPLYIKLNDFGEGRIGEARDKVIENIYNAFFGIKKPGN